jgi:hypothetical protein
MACFAVELGAGSELRAREQQRSVFGVRGQPRFGALQHLERLIGFDFAVGKDRALVPGTLDAFAQLCFGRLVIVTGHRGARVGDDDIRATRQCLRNVFPG